MDQEINGRQPELSGEGTILLVKKGNKLLKYETESKKTTELKGLGELTGGLVKKGSQICMVSCISGPQRIDKLQLNDDEWSLHPISSHGGQERSMAAFATYGDHLFVIGGAQHKKLSSGERFDFKSQQWTKIRDMTSCRSGHAVVEYDALTSGTSSAERFDADPDQSYEDWKEMTAMTHERYGLAAVEMNGKIYAIGCDNSHGRVLNSVEIYDPQKESWEKGASMNKERCWHGACRIGHKIHVAGGETNVMESYDLRTNQWIEEKVDDAFENVHSMFSI